MTTYTTKITASIPAPKIESAHDFLVGLLPPEGDRFFGTAPNMAGPDGDYLVISTVMQPERGRRPTRAALPGR